MMAWTIWFLATFFYFYEYFLRVFPSEIVPQLERDFQIQAGRIGVISAFYFYIYAPMQLPVGLLMDRFGARRLLTFASLVCGIGAVVFGLAAHVFMLDIGRLLMGLGSAFAFLGMVYICTHWFPARRAALMIGIGNSLGVLGAVGGEGPLSLVINILGWRETILILGFVGIALAVVIYFLVRNEPENMQKHDAKVEDYRSLLSNSKLVFQNKQAWLIGIINFFYYATIVAFGTLWGVPFLQKAFQMSQAKAGFALSMIFIGWVIGGPIAGHYSDVVRNRRTFIRFFTLFGGLLFLPLLFISPMPDIFVFLLLFTLGLSLSAQILTYCYAVEILPSEVKGTAIALTNFLGLTSGIIFQPFVGFVLDLVWEGGMQQGVPVYTLKDYQYALICFPIAFFIAFLLSFFLKKIPTKKWTG